MPELVIKYPDRKPDILPLGRLRITIGRSARNDLCLPDPFASRVHAEVRREGDQFVLRDLGSANGTFYNGLPVQGPITIAPGGRIQIGETEIEVRDDKDTTPSGATMIAEAATLPSATITVANPHQTTSGLLETIAGARDRRKTAEVIAERSTLLELISKVGVTLLDSATLDETLQKIAGLVFEAVPADRCMIMLRDEPSGELKVRVARLRDRDGDTGEFRLSRAVIAEVVGRGKSVLTSDAQQDPRFTSGTMAIQGIHSVLAVPLGVGEKLFGLIYADSPLVEGRFTGDHLKVLTTLASVAAIRVENARLLEERLERERLERELQLAREIQERFQPSAPPYIPGYELEGISFPCYEIGGDYYDFIAGQNGRVMIALGDVSGKGTSAALLMSSLHAAIHAHLASCNSLVTTTIAVNNYLADNIPANRFVTLFSAELNPATGEITYLNAGHNSPFIVRASGAIERLTEGGIPLGITRNAVFGEGDTRLNPGDTLVVYSDGVTETRNPQDEEFGEARLHQVVVENRGAPASTIRDRIEAALSKFARGTPSADDITLVIVKRKDEG
jgi:serine phosphatase RsbU (regulator of sigma subunit)